MARINYKELRRQYDAKGAEATVTFLRECFATKQMSPSDFSIAELFEDVVPDGREAIRLFDPKHADGYTVLREAGAVNTAAFSNITGQLAYSAVLEGYMAPELVFTKATKHISTRLSGEKIPGITNLGDDVSIVGENKPYPNVGVSEDYVETPETYKRGVIVPVTKEAVFFDRTGLVLQRAGEVGEAMGKNKEKRIADVWLGVTNPYKWRGTTYNTYVDTPWDNLSASTALADWANVDTVIQLLNAMTDPDTSEPILISGNTLVVPQALWATAMRITNATQVRQLSGTGNNSATYSDSPIPGIKPMTSPYVYNRTSSTSTWFFGDPSKAFAYMENQPVQVTQAPQNSEAEFTNDIVARYKVSERGAAAVLNPRYMVKATA